MKQLFLLLMILSLLGCSNGTSNTSEHNNSIVIAAAANLVYAFEEIGQNFEKEYDINITFSFGSSGQLADQLEHGAPFDIFASADEYHIDKLININKVEADSKVIFGLGRIGISSLQPIDTLDDLLADNIKKIAIANPNHAPYGFAAKEAMEATGVWEELESKLVYSRNISEAFTMLETGNVEASIIALSLKKEGYPFTLIDEKLHSPLKKSIAINRDSLNKEAASLFINYLQRPEGKVILEKYGFVLQEGE